MGNRVIAPAVASETASPRPMSTSTAGPVVAVTAAPDEAARSHAGPAVPLPRPERLAADRGTLAAHDSTVGRGLFRTPASASITITTQRHERVLIQVRGRLDRVGIARLRTALTQARGLGGPQLVVDLRSVTWWDHSLARALAWVRLQLRGHEHNLILAGATAGLLAEIDNEENGLGYPLWRGLRPGDAGYRPETADQP